MDNAYKRLKNKCAFKLEGIINYNNVIQNILSCKIQCYITTIYILYIFYPQPIRLNTNNTTRIAAPNFNNFHTIDLLHYINI